MHLFSSQMASPMETKGDSYVRYADERIAYVE